MPAAKPERLFFPGPRSGFEVGCSQCLEGYEATDTLRLDFVSPESGLAGLRLSQAFDYRIEASGEQSFASVLAVSNVRVQLQAGGLDDVVSNPIEATFAMVFSPSNNFSVFQGDAAEGRIEGRLDIDLYSVLGQAGAAAHGAHRIDSVTLEITTSLMAFHGYGSGFARIGPSADPDEAFLEVGQYRGICLSCEAEKPLPSVPEPGTAMLMLLGLAGLTVTPRV